MTLDELHGAWQRWMHRRDMNVDLPIVDELTRERIMARLMYIPEPDPVPDDWLEWAAETMPRVAHHAGLVSLHELAQDDEGLQRELALFDRAMKDHHFQRSINTVTPEMKAGW
jgi:hypothetical protein